MDNGVVAASFGVLPGGCITLKQGRKLKTQRPDLAPHRALPDCLTIAILRARCQRAGKLLTATFCHFLVDFMAPKLLWVPRPNFCQGGIVTSISAWRLPVKVLRRQRVTISR
jgi:hypothetical protein